MDEPNFVGSQGAEARLRKILPAGPGLLSAGLDFLSVEP